MPSVLKLYLTSEFRMGLLRTTVGRLQVHNRHLSFGSIKDDNAIILLIMRCEAISPDVEYHLKEDRTGYFALEEPFFSLVYDLDEFRRAAFALKKLERVNYYLIDGQLVTRNTISKLLLPEIPWLRIVFNVEGDHPLDDLYESYVNASVSGEIYKHRLLPVKKGLTYDLATGKPAIPRYEVKAPIFIEDGDVHFYQPMSCAWFSVDNLRRFICCIVEEYEDNEVVRIPYSYGMTNLNPNHVYHVRHLRNVENIVLSGNQFVVGYREGNFFIKPDPSIEYIWQQYVLWREVP